jgi:hypothetical protein
MLNGRPGRFGVRVISNTRLSRKGFDMTLTSWKSGSLAAAFCLALWASPAVAQRSDDMRPGQGGQHPCTGDAQSICSEFIPDRGKVASCLFKNKARLSSACAASLGGGGKTKVSRKAKGKHHGKRRRHRR